MPRLPCPPASLLKFSSPSLPPHPRGSLCLKRLAPRADGIEIKITDELVSQPYVDMTVKLMERFGVKVRRPRSTNLQPTFHGSKG